MLNSLIVSILLTLMSTFVIAEEPENQTPPPADKEVHEASKAIFGIDPKNKFSLYQPSYFIFGKENLKMQFSSKYRVAKNYNLYLAYTQVMFWDIYEQSAPFNDINYNPEIFYRLIEGDTKFIRSIDFGYHHTSN